MPSGGKQSFKDFLWNSEEKKFLGRTGSNWLKIGVFYVIFYACLLAFWVLCLAIFLRTIDRTEPKWTTNTGGLIGKTPGLGYRPRPSEENIESTLIRFNSGKAENWEKLVTKLIALVDSYDTKKSGSLVECSDTVRPTKDQSCIFPKEFTHCNKNNKFGYNLGQPCVLLKLNKVLGWTPQPYTNVSQLPEEMPDHVRQVIMDGSSGDSITDENIWVSCEGDRATDKENLGHLQYYPGPYIKSMYFPFLKQSGYQSPFVAVHVTNATRGLAISIVCRYWSQDVLAASSTTQFDLMID